MSDARAWETSTKPARMLDLHPPGRGRKARLLLVACCRAAWAQLRDEARAAVLLGERMADGPVDAVELRNTDTGLRLDIANVSACAIGATEVFEDAARVWRGGPLRGELSALANARSRAEDELSALRAAHATIAEAISAEVLECATLLPATEVTVALLRDIFGNPFRPVAFDPAWRTDTAVAIARTMYESRNFGAMPILADALQDAGCENAEVLNHCRDPHAIHCRGCWVVDLVLGLS